MRTLILKDDEVLLLKAAWEHLVNSDDHIDDVADALEVNDEDRGLDEADDPIITRVAALGLKIMNL